jgi:hypothetical protein
MLATTILQTLKVRFSCEFCLRQCFLLAVQSLPKTNSANSLTALAEKHKPNKINTTATSSSQSQANTPSAPHRQLQQQQQQQQQQSNLLASPNPTTTQTETKAIGTNHANEKLALVGFSGVKQQQQQPSSQSTQQLASSAMMMNITSVSNTPKQSPTGKETKATKPITSLTQLADPSVTSSDVKAQHLQLFP